MRQDGVDLGGSVLYQLPSGLQVCRLSLGKFGDKVLQSPVYLYNSATSIRHVVHQDGHLASGVTHQHHARNLDISQPRKDRNFHLVRLLPLLVNESEVNVEPVGDGRHSLGSSGVRGDHDGALEEQEGEGEQG